MPIYKRPKVVKQRKRPGDIDVDFMIDRNHKGAQLVMIDRATLQINLHKIENKNSSIVSKTLIKRHLKSKHPIYLITLDNDKVLLTT